jgi:uncharacterized membrane protein
VTAPPNTNIAPPGYYMLFVLNSAGVPSVASFLQLLPQTPDFTVAATPTSRSVTQGNSAQYTVNIAAIGGFTGAVALSSSGQPSGGTVTFNPSTVTGSGSSTLTVSTTATTATGSYPISIKGTSGALSHSVGVTLVVNSSTTPDFTVTSTPTSRSVTQGNSAAYTVSVTASGGFSGAVGFSLTGQPAGSTVNFNPNTVTGSGSSTLTVSTTATTATGSYPMTITATSGALSHTVGVTLVVNGSTPPDFTLSANPTSLAIARGSSGNFTLTIGGLNGFANSVSLSLKGLPNKTNFSFTPASISGSGSSTLKISVNKPATPGTYGLTISGTGGGITHSANVTLTIQ